MKWVTLIKDFKEKVGFSQTSPSAHTASASSASSALSAWDNNAFSDSQNLGSSSARDKYELVLDCKRFWEEFRSSNSEKEKEAALDQTVDAFCRLAKHHVNVAQLFAMLVETHLFSFVVGRALVTDIEKLKTIRKTRYLDAVQVFEFFSEVTKDRITPRSNLLTAVEILVSGVYFQSLLSEVVISCGQSLLDSGIFSCLIRILNALLDPNISIQRPSSATNHEEPAALQVGHDGDAEKVRQLEVEGSIVHILKGLASHPSAAQSLIEDESLQMLFEMVSKGSLTVFYRYKEGLITLHSIQLHRHAMQILRFLLVNDNGSTASYIRKHNLVIIWDLTSMVFVRQLPKFTAQVSAIFVNDLTGEIVTAAGILLAVWIINGDCLAMIKTSQLPSDSILSVTSSTFSDWLDTNWYVTGHQSGAVKVWQMVHSSDQNSSLAKSTSCRMSWLNVGAKEPEYRLVLHKILKFHKYPALHLASDLKRLLSGDSGGHLLSWTLPDENVQGSLNRG